MDVKNRVKLTSYEDLFGEEEKFQPATMAKKAADAETVMLAPEILMEFPGHPFHVRHDEDMEELIEAIKEYEVLEPIWAIERKKDVVYPTDGYYIVAGHRRRYAAQQAGLSEVPVKLLSLTDKEATDYMVYSNIHRPKIYPSELANAFKLQQEQNRKAGIVIDESGKQSRKRQRYIRLTFLIDGFMSAIDEEKMQISVGYEISFLSFAQQLKLFSYLKSNDIKPTIEQAKALKNIVKQNPDTDFVGNIYLDEVFKGKSNSHAVNSPKEKNDMMSFTRDESDDNIPGQTSIEEDFPEYLPNDQKKQDTMPEKEEDRIEEECREVEESEKEEVVIDGKYREIEEKEKVATSQPEEELMTIPAEKEEKTNSEPEEPEQQEFPVLKNNDQRKEWLTKYKDWGLWYRDERIDVNYYKFDFEDGSRLVVTEYPQRHSYWNDESKDEHYYHLLEKNKKGCKKPYDEKYRHKEDCETYLVEFLKNLQKNG